MGVYNIDNEAFEHHHIIATLSEANDKVGYLKENGEWLIPPIFDWGESFDDGHCVLSKIGEQQYLVNSSGEIIPFDYEIDTEKFCGDRCAFRLEKYDGEITYPDEEYFDELSPGLWGYIDQDGKVIIEPQFVFATGFGLCDDNCAFVARLIDGKPMWGLVDQNGKEIIECKYPNLATHHGTAVNFQTEEGGLYGIMDTKGDVIMEPRYRYIYEYNREHGLIAAGDVWDQYGVADIATGKVIAPFEYDCISFEDRYIECERIEGGSDLFDYDGNTLPADLYDCSCKTDEGYRQWKNQKCGLVDENGNVIIPHVFDESKYLEYYLQGFCVTGEKGRYGLTGKDGTKILDELYSDITIRDGFIISSQNREGNWCLIDELYTLDGAKVFTDTFRNVRIEEGTLSRETPFGQEFYRIIRK